MILLKKIVPISTVSLILSFSTLTVHIPEPFAESNFLKIEIAKAETADNQPDLPVVQSENVLFNDNFPTSQPVIYVDTVLPYGKRLSIIDRSPFPSSPTQLNEACPGVERPVSELISIWSREFIQIYAKTYTSRCNSIGQPGAIDVVIDGKSYHLPILRLGESEYPGLFATDTPLLRALQNVSSERVEIRIYGSELQARENPNVFKSTVVNPSTVRAFQAIYNTLPN